MLKAAKLGREELCDMEEDRRVVLTRGL